MAAPSEVAFLRRCRDPCSIAGPEHALAVAALHSLDAFRVRAFSSSEVVDLERIIKSLHSTRTDERYAREQAEALLTHARHESVAHEGQRQLVHGTIHSLQAQHAAALTAAAAREAEARTLAVELRLLCAELFDAETEHEAAREAEGSALSIARSYRSFAAQGAARLRQHLRPRLRDVRQRWLLRR